MTQNALTETEIVSQIETLRRKIRSLQIGGAVTVIPGVFIAVLMVFIRDFGGAEEVSVPLVFILVAIILAGFIMLTMSGKEARKLNAFVSEYLVYGILSETFGNLEYAYNKRLDEAQISATGLVGGWNTISGSDYFKGTYQNVAVEFSDITLIHSEQGADDNFPTETKKFKGPWLICDFGENLSAGKDSSKKSIAELHADMVKTEEKLKEPVQYYFDGSRVHIAVYNNYNFFEIGNMSAAVNSLDALRDKFRREVSYLTGLIDNLMQNKL